MPKQGIRSAKNTPTGTEKREGGEAWLMLDNQLCFAAYSLSREITGLYRPHLEKLGLTYTQYITFLVLWECGEVTMKALGEHLFLDSGTLTPLLKKLARAGYVEKERDASDERSVIVRLTPAGWALRDKVLGIPMQILCGTGLQAEVAMDMRDRMKKLAADIRAVAQNTGDIMPDESWKEE